MTLEAGTRVLDTHYPRKGTVVSAPITFSDGTYASRNVLVDWDDMSRRWVSVNDVRALQNAIPTHLQRFVLDMPALHGETVCQGHADVCKILGHGKNLRNGVELGTCPRCGIVKP